MGGDTRRLGDQIVAGQEFAQALKQRFLSRQVVERQKLSNRRHVHLSANGWISQDGLQFRGKPQRTAVVEIVQRFDAHPVARHEQAASFRVPNGEGKHPAELLDALGTLVLVQMNNDFRVGLRAKYVAPLDQPLPKLVEVVNLAIEHNPDRIVLIREGLASRAQVNDGEPTMSQTDVSLDVMPVPVRTPVGQKASHPLHQPGVNAGALAIDKFPRNAAHTRLRLFLRPDAFAKE